MPERPCATHDTNTSMISNSGSSIADRTVRLGRALQASGVGVSLSEIIDAAKAVTVIDLWSRVELREALRATLVKNSRHDSTFDSIFERFFPARPLRDSDSEAVDEIGDLADLASAIADGRDLHKLAAALVDEHGGLDGELRGERHHVHRVFIGADIARLMSRVRIADPNLTTAALRARIDELKRLIAADVRAHLDPHLGQLIDDDLQDVDFLNATREELEQIRAAIRPIARRVAARLARRRQHRRGRLNMRRTVRRSLGSGGVPLDVVHDRPRAHKPELFVLCDISGSVAEFSLFTLTLMSALSAEIARTRSFVFIDAVDEITSLLDDTRHGIEPWQLMRNSNVIGVDGHSDYGAVFDQFWDETGNRDLKRTSTLIVTGDARTNHRSVGIEQFARIAERCRRVYWLNPEPIADWDTHDSAMAQYSKHCDATFEVRNLQQLVACVEQIF